MTARHSEIEEIVANVPAGALLAGRRLNTKLVDIFTRTLFDDAATSGVCHLGRGVDTASPVTKSTSGDQHREVTDNVAATPAARTERRPPSYLSHQPQAATQPAA